MKLEPDEIYATVRKMAVDVRTRKFTRDELEKKYADLLEDSKTLFNMAYEDNFNYLPMLNTFIDQLKTIKDKETSDKSDVIIGQLLFDKYAKPHIDTSKEETD